MPERTYLEQYSASINRKMWLFVSERINNFSANIFRTLSLVLVCVAAACSSTGKFASVSPGAPTERQTPHAESPRQLPDPDKRCDRFREITDEAVASNIGLTLQELDLLKGSRSLTNEEICVMPTAKLARAIYKSKNPLRPDYPQEWAKLRAMQQASEDGMVRPDGLAVAIEQRQEMLALNMSVMPAAGILRDEWTSLGPDNIGGRIRTAVIHPTDTDMMWIGSVGGGIWKSSNGGTTWSAVDDFMGNLSVSSLVIDPSDPNIMYAGTGEGYFNSDALRGYGVFKSTDGGVTWNFLASTTPDGNVNSAGYNWFYVNRLTMSGGVLLAATSGHYSNWGAIYRSTNGGSTWTSVYSSGRVDQVLFDPNNSSNALATARSYNFDTSQWETHILKTTNGGANWSSAQTFTNSYGRVELAYSKSNSSVVYASRDNSSGEIWKSTDGGGTWTQMSTPGHLGAQGWYDNTIWVSPTDPNFIVIGGIDLYRSTNGGSSWTKISQWWSWPSSAHADQHMIIQHPMFDGVTNRTVFFGNDGGIWKTSDVSSVSLTSGWTNLNNSIGITQFYGGAGNSGAGKIIGGTQDNGHLMYTGSSSWTQTKSGDGGFAAVDPSNSNYMYGEYVYLDLYRSTNGGLSYSDICNGITESYCSNSTQALFISPFVLDPNNSSIMLAGAASLWRSTNVKAQHPLWSAIKSPVTGSKISAIAVAQGNSNVIWVGYNNGQIYYTTNGTAGSPTWTSVGSGVLPARYVTRILVDKDSSSKVYVAFGGYDPDNLYVSTDGGTIWTDISGDIPSAPIRSIVRHPLNADWLYAGTEVGIFTSEDGGNTWKTTNDGPANVSVDELFWYSDSQLVAATHGRGMFMVTLHGSCAFSISPSGESFTSSGGSGTVAVNASSNICDWSVSNPLSTWVTLTSGGGGGTGDGQVQYTVSPNTGAYRLGNITVAGGTFVVAQDGTRQSCLTVSVKPANAGTVTYADMTCADSCVTCLYDPGQNENMHAAAQSGYQFASWTGCDNPSGSDCAQTIWADESVIANFNAEGCSNPPVRISAGPTYYYAIQDVYDAASGGDILQSQALAFTEDLFFDRNISVVLKGGYDCSYSGNALETTVKGSISITTGTVVLDRIVIR